MRGFLERGQVKHRGRDRGHLRGQAGDAGGVHLVEVTDIGHKVGEILQVVVDIYNGIYLSGCHADKEINL